MLPRGLKRKGLLGWKLVVVSSLFLVSVWYFEFGWEVKNPNSSKVSVTRLRGFKAEETLRTRMKTDRAHQHKEKMETYMKLAQLFHNRSNLQVENFHKRIPILFDNGDKFKQKHVTKKADYKNKVGVTLTTKEKRKSKVLKYTKSTVVYGRKTTEKSHLSRKTTSGKIKKPQRKEQLCAGSDLKTAPPDKQAFLPVTERPMYVFSAFLDTRAELGGSQIRIIAAGLQLAYNKIPPIFCTSWWKGKDGRIYAVNSGEAKYKVIYQSTLWPRMYTSHFILCDITVVDTEQFPVAVSVVANPCDKYSNILPVQKLIVPKQNIPHTFSLCVSPLYGRVSHAQLTEFIEIHRLLGVEKFTFYKYSISEQLEKLLHYYQTQNIVNLVDWKFPRHVEQSYFMQRVALNDCLYRNMAHSKFVGIYDLDEVVVPKNGVSWNEMFPSLVTSHPKGGAFLFQHAYFRRNNSVKSDPYLMTQTSRWRTSKVFPEGKIRCKSIHHAQRCLAVDIHFPYSLLPGYQEVIVEPDIAILHHYRESPMSNFNKQNSLHFIEDNTLLKYGGYLKRRMSEIIKYVD